MSDQQDQVCVSVLMSFVQGACSPEEIYPNVLATFKDVRSISTTQDLARVVVDESMQFFKLVKDVVLPENADRILDMCLMSIEVGPAIASLYHIQGLSAQL